MIVLIVVTTLTAVTGVLGAATVVGSFGRRGPARTTSDFLVASRSVTPLWNASAISSEYVSAAAFLGTAGLVLTYGADMLWLPIGAAAGYVVVLVLITGPLRRSGVYTLSDFAEWRLGSRRLRHAVSGCICFIGWFYLLPQFQGAGVTLRVVAGMPVWVGWAIVVVVVLGTVLFGGMRSITVVQAFQFWFKLLALAIPAVVLVVIWRLHGGPDPTRPYPPAFVRPTTVSVAFHVGLRVPVGTQGWVDGVVDGRRYHGEKVLLAAGRHVVAEDTRIAFPAGAAVPHAEQIPVQCGDRWARPFGRSGDHPLFGTYSMLLGMLLGTMGLPHIVVRFYTNTNGRAARRTVTLVLAMLSLFYVFPTLYGALGRVFTPELLMTGDADATILMLPGRLVPGLAGTLLTGLVAAGAFAAFVSTSCGVVVAIAGTLSQSGSGTGVRKFRIGAVIAITVPLTLVGWLGTLGAAGLVTLAFVISACSLCPLLVLGVWWRGLTPIGAGAGLVVGCGCAVAAGLTQIIAGRQPGWWGTLLGQPAIAVVPLTFLVMVVVSLLTRAHVPRGVDRAMARLHLPEELLKDRP
ncbi:MAG TPA: cation acetate symporter [Streptosporangiaceae bacterium]|nr:cation acetate symporter [Streptosporangiaceae bacterium]